MKRIRALEEPTPGLIEYREEEGDSATWDGFGSHRGSSDAKWELAEGLANVQHGLCGYCEINLHPRDREIEHVIPRSDTERGGAERALDHANMIACCRGNASEPHHPDLRGDPARFLRPVNAHRSCGQAKGDQSSDEFRDPRTLPALPSVVRVSFVGEIAPNHDACTALGVDIDSVERTIQVLGLNVPRLRDARAARWRDLQDDWPSYDDDPAKIRAAAKRELLPDESGRLPAFFTTTRSFFEPLAEAILDEADLSWV